MALRQAILAALLVIDEASGYDLAKDFDGARANFWVASPQQIYRELDVMEDDGVVAARTVEQSKRPNKRVFRLTDAGRDELGEFVHTDPRPPAIRDDLLVMVQASGAGDSGAVADAIRQRRDFAEAKLVHYQRLESIWLEGRSREELLTDARLAGPYLTLLRGLRFEEENVQWCDFALSTVRSWR